MNRAKDYAIIAALVAVVIAAGAVTYRQVFPAGTGKDVVPQPNDFAVKVRESYKGEDPDRIILVALFDHAASAITYDGTTQAPRLQTTNEAFECYRSLMKYYFGKDKTPFADKYPEFRKVVSAELYTRLGQEEGGEDKQLTPELRIAMAKLFAEVADALRK